MSETLLNKQRGRRPANIQWPDVPFTVNEAEQYLLKQGVKLSKVGIQVRINKDINKGVLVFVENRTGFKGAPSKIYKLADA
jgi:hypothetical protein